LAAIRWAAGNEARVILGPEIILRLHLVIPALLLLSCALASPIAPAATSKSPFWFIGWGDREMLVSKVPDGEQFRISHRGSTGFTPVSALRRSAQVRATEFCEGKGRAMTPISEQTSSHPHILGNFPRIEIIFVCTEKPLTANAVPAAEDPYKRLIRLKELLDAGAISQEEFDQEKREVLER
jgi:hypothetical protein